MVLKFSIHKQGKCVPYSLLPLFHCPTTTLSQMTMHLYDIIKVAERPKMNSIAAGYVCRTMVPMKAEISSPHCKNRLVVTLCAHAQQGPVKRLVLILSVCSYVIDFYIFV